MTIDTARDRYQSDATADRGGREQQAMNRDCVSVTYDAISHLNDTLHWFQNTQIVRMLLRSATHAVRELWFALEDPSAATFRALRRALDILDEADETAAGVRAALDGVLDEIRGLEADDGA